MVDVGLRAQDFEVAQNGAPPEPDADPSKPLFTAYNDGGSDLYLYDGKLF